MNMLIIKTNEFRYLKLLYTSFLAPNEKGTFPWTFRTNTYVNENPNHHPSPPEKAVATFKKKFPRKLEIFKNKNISYKSEEEVPVCQI